MKTKVQAVAGPKFQAPGSRSDEPTQLHANPPTRRSAPAAATWHTQPRPRNTRHGMTLVELMVAMGLFAFVSVGLLYTHVFCLRQDQLVNSKLGASDQSRRGFDLLTRDIRSAKVWEVGTASGTNFTQITDGTAQQGNALRLSYTTNWNQGVLYYFDTSNLADEGGKLYRIRRSTGATSLIASYLTNNMFFRAENYLGAVQTNRTHKGVIKVKMEFAQYQYPLTRVGPGYFYDYYKMEFKLTSHVPDGP